MNDTPIKDIAMNFEAVKVSMSQDKNGIILRLNVHPNDCPKELHTDWVGTRYVVAMVKLQDDDTPDDRGYVGIQSRSEFRDNETAREKFEALRGEFRNWKQGRPNEREHLDRLR